MFYSAQTGGFYSVENHGPRLITIADPAWLRPTRDIVLAPGEAAQVGDQMVTNHGDEPMTVEGVPDMDAVSDTLEVVNPACLIPADALEITRELHTALLDGQTAGQVISSDEHGYPLLVDRPAPSPEYFESVERVWRDGQLAATDGVVSRHRDEQEEGLETTLTSAQYAELQAYRRALRNWPETGEFPLIEHRPPSPGWLIGPLQ